jgi:hypothetical protein
MEALMNPLLPITGYPPGIGYVSCPLGNGEFTIALGTYVGVWQRLSTCKFGEVVSDLAFSLAF